jgi:serine protease DegS
MANNKNTSTSVFLLAAALCGFFIALGYDYLLQNQSVNTEKISSQREPGVVLIHNQPPTPGINSFAPAVNRAAPAVVNIFTRKLVKQRDNLYNNSTLRALLENRRPPARYREEINLGSGVIVSSEGHILTNYHVISGAEDIEVLLKDGRFLNANLVGRDLETDLALLKVTAKDLPTIHFGDSSAIQVGDIVLAIGNPFGLGHTVTSGIISAINRSQFRANNFDNFIQTDAAINPGNSGGALVNARGEMIGLNTINVSSSGGSQGIGFAIPSDMAQKIMQQLIQFGEVKRGWIGIEARELSPMLAKQLDSGVNHGLLIIGILSNGPGQKAGINLGDIITHINGIKIHSAKKALELITHLQPGDIAILKGVRQNQSIQFKVIAEERPQMSAYQPTE